MQRMIFEVVPRTAATVSDVRIPELRHGTDMSDAKQRVESKDNEVQAKAATFKLAVVVEKRKDRKHRKRHGVASATSASAM